MRPSSVKKKNMVEFAKELYLEVDTDGNKLHTWDYISNELLKKFKVKLHLSTISKWSKKYHWEDLFERIKMAGIEKSKAEFQDKENKLIDERSKVIADIYNSNKTIQTLANQTILARITGQELKNKDGAIIKTDMQTQDVIRLLQHSEATLLELHEKRKEERGKTVGNTVIQWGDNKVQLNGDN